MRNGRRSTVHHHADRVNDMERLSVNGFPCWVSPKRFMELPFAIDSNVNVTTHWVVLGPAAWADVFRRKLSLVADLGDCWTDGLIGAGLQQKTASIFPHRGSESTKQCSPFTVESLKFTKNSQISFILRTMSGCLNAPEMRRQFNTIENTQKHNANWLRTARWTCSPVNARSATDWQKIDEIRTTLSDSDAD